MLRTRLVSPKPSSAGDDGEQDAAGLGLQQRRSRSPSGSVVVRCRRRRRRMPAIASQPAWASDAEDRGRADEDDELRGHHLHPARHPEQQRDQRAGRPLRADPGGADERTASDGGERRRRPRAPSVPGAAEVERGLVQVPVDAADSPRRSAPGRRTPRRRRPRGAGRRSSRHCCRNCSFVGHVGVDLLPARRRSSSASGLPNWVSAMTVAATQPTHGERRASTWMNRRDRKRCSSARSRLPKPAAARSGRRGRASAAPRRRSCLVPAAGPSCRLVAR